MWINSKGSNICEIGVSEGERKNKAEKNDEIIAKTFSELVKKKTPKFTRNSIIPKQDMLFVDVYLLNCV